MSPDHRDTSHNQIKQPRSHMQDDQQLPRAPPALTYSICFSSRPVTPDTRLSVCKRSGFQGLTYVSDELCAALIFSLLTFCWSALLHTNHIFHPSGSVCIQRHSMHDLQHHASDYTTTFLSAQCSRVVGSCSARLIYLCHCVHLRRILKLNHLGFLLVIGLFIFKSCSLASVFPFSLNSPGVEGQAPETSDDFVAIKDGLIFSLIIDSW